MRVCDKCSWENVDPRTDADSWCAHCGDFLGFSVASTDRERHIQLLPISEKVSVLPGQEAVLTARVHNAGKIVEKVRLTVAGAVADWACVEPAEVGLFPNQKSEFRLVFRPPRSSAVLAGMAPFRLLATSESDATVSDGVEGTLVIGTFIEIKASLVPLRSAGPSGAEHRLVVENTGNTVVDVPLEVSEPGDELSLNIEPRTVRVNPGARSEARVRVVPREPLDGAADRTFGFAVTVRAPNQAATVIQAVHVQEAQATAPTLVLGESDLHAGPGGEASTAIIVRNRGRGGETYSLEVLGPAAAWARVVPPTLTLPTAGGIDARVVLAPPGSPPMSAGQVPFAVRCRSQVDPGRSVVAEGRFTIDAVSAIDFDVVPSLARGRWSGRYVVELENRGNSLASLRPTVVDQEHNLSFAVSPRTLDVGAGQRAVVVVKAKTRRPKLFSKGSRHPFEVLVTPTVDAGRVASRRDGTGQEVVFEQTSVVPRGIAAFVAVLVVLAALGGAGVGIWALASKAKNTNSGGTVTTTITSTTRQAPTTPPTTEGTTVSTGTTGTTG